MNVADYIDRPPPLTKNSSLGERCGTARLGTGQDRRPGGNVRGGQGSSCRQLGGVQGSAIFCASKMSLRARFPLGRKHQTATRAPRSSSSSMFI